LTRYRRPIAIATFAIAATAFLPSRERVDAAQPAPAGATEEFVHVRSDDGIINGGAMFAPPVRSASSIAVIWIPGSGVNFYYPTYVKIGREVAARGIAFIAANTRMHDLGTVAAGVEGGKRIRGGAYWGRYSDQARDIAAWIDLANQRGFKQVVLAGHSAGTTAVETYQAEKQDPRVVGLVLASGRFQPVTTPTDQEMLAEARRLVAEGRGEELLHYPNRTTPSFVSAATFLDLDQWLPKDFFGVQTPDPPVMRIRCPILAFFGTNEADVGTESDLSLLKSTLKRMTTGPGRVDTVMIQDAGHMYDGHEAQVADTIAKWARSLLTTARAATPTSPPASRR
jgi:pimeloyl-ACP methyl ester carboxylesterase